MNIKEIIVKIMVILMGLFMLWIAYVSCKIGMVR